MQMAENRQAAKQQTRLKLTTPVRQAGNTWVVSDSDSEEYVLQLSKLAVGERNRHTGNARNLTWAVHQYARDHQGEIPATFAEVAPYKWKGELPLAGSFKERDTMAGANDFEIVYHGSLNDLTNIPGQAVALIRQRDPWPTPNGKWARIYTMADGRVCALGSYFPSGRPFDRRLPDQQRQSGLQFHQGTHLRLAGRMGNVSKWRQMRDNLSSAN